MKKTAKVENWSIIQSGTEYSAPETLTCHLVGSLIEHHTLNCSYKREIYSSPIKEVCLEQNRVETENTIYELVGPPESGYAEFLKNRNN